jgi:nicotinamide-nucleotide amidase
MVERDLLPWLARQRPAPAVIVSRTMKTTGLVESHVHRRIARWMRQEPPVTIGIYAGRSEVEIVVTAQAASRPAALRLIAPIERAIRTRLRPWLFGTDDETLEAVVGRRLAQRRLTIAVAESCSGGLLTHRLTNVPGSSRYLTESVVAYSNAAKMRRLLVPERLIARHGAVSAPAAAAMARGIRQTAGASLGVAITGIAGPSGGTVTKPVGLFFVALSHPRGTLPRRYRFLGSREEIKWRVAQAALDMVRRWLR